MDGKDNSRKDRATAVPIVVVAVFLSGCQRGRLESNEPIQSTGALQTLNLGSDAAPRWSQVGRVKLPAGAKTTDAARTAVTEDGFEGTIEKGSEVIRIEANDARVVIAGDCALLEVTGSGNHIQGGSVEEIRVPGDRNRLVLDSVDGGTVSGNENRVTWRRPAGGGAPMISFRGLNNQIEHVAPDEGETLPSEEAPGDPLPAGISFF